MGEPAKVLRGAMAEHVRRRRTPPPVFEVWGHSEPAAYGPILTLQCWWYDLYHTHTEVYAMRTNIVLDPKLIKEAMRLSKVRTKREAVDVALREFVARGKQRDILALLDKELIAPDYDVRTVRKTMPGRATSHGAR